jgi:hypothetical protein
MYMYVYTYVLVEAAMAYVLGKTLMCKDSLLVLQYLACWY